MIKRLSMISVVLLSVSAINISSCQPTGVIDDLGTLGGDFSTGLGINKFGNVTGNSYKGTAGHSGVHAFLYVDGLGMIDVGALPTGDISEGNGVNNNNFVVGGSFVFRTDSIPNAFIANSTLDLTDIGTVDMYSYAWDINDRGQVTGEADTPASTNTHAFLWTRTDGLNDIGTLGGTQSAGRSINENGQIAGESKIRNDSATHAFRYTQGVGMVDLGTLGGKYSSAYGINDSGQVVGESSTGFDNTTKFIFRDLTTSFLGTHAFLWTEGVGMIDLGHLGGGYSIATAINNNGVVVGYSKLMDGTEQPFRWTRGGGIINLNNLLPRGSGWVLNRAYDINDKGQITGGGVHNGKYRAFRLNPAPDPTVKP